MYVMLSVSSHCIKVDITFFDEIPGYLCLLRMIKQVIYLVAAQLAL